MSRIGVFICRCDARRDRDRSLESLAESAAQQQGVAYVATMDDLCSRKFASDLVEACTAHGLDAAVVAVCSPEAHLDSLRSALSIAGIGLRRVSAFDPCSAADGKAELAAAISEVSGADPGPPDESPAPPRALVIGGGVAGIQASLDIADGGYEVLLVEKDSSIGGHMLQLSEVFPTLDCPQCIMTPKMVQVNQHPNIRLMAYSEVESIEDSAGGFRARIRHKTPYIDWVKCTGCGECARVCPVKIPSEWDRAVSTRGATYRPFAQAVPNKFTIEKRGISPCRNACPAGLNAHAYVSLAAAGKYDKALAIVREGVLFPGILGRVCPHPCETACLRGQVDEPVRICAIKRFLADNAKDPVPLPEIAADTGKKVAVVGAGPAGLAAAYDLRRSGHDVSAIEASDRVGGMMCFGIPEYRLPRQVIRNETEDLLKAMGVKFRLNASVGKDVMLSDLKSSNDAVVLAVGAWKASRLGVPSEDLPGVYPGIDFLVKVNGGGSITVGARVVVVGGGNTAIDAARVSLRLGASDVTIVYRRSRAEMPASPEEIEAAEQEGIRIRILCAPVSIEASGGKAAGLKIVRTRLGEPDKSGRRRPEPVPGSEEVIPADTIIPAVSQEPDLSPFLDVPATRRETFETDPVTLATGVAGVFAAGDAVTGPATVVSAIAQGRRAAESVSRFLKGEDLSAGRFGEGRRVVETPDTRIVKPGSRPHCSELGPESRVCGFEEVDLGLTEDDVRAEAGRCLSCAGCCECMECVSACEAKAVDHAIEDEVIEEEVGAVVLATGYDLYDKHLVSEYDPDPDVIDGLQFERILCPSGPSDGKVFRPSDGSEPRSVAFIACVGSRDPEHHKAYCSRVCCLYSIKMAMLYKHAVHHGDAYFFYMDVRTDGKLYEEFYQRAQQEEGVKFIRGRVSRIFRDGGHLLVRSVDTLSDRAIEVKADLVVLATAMVPRPEGVEAAGRFGLALDSTGFARERHSKLMPLDSSRPGIFLAGTCQGPKDIPECVAHASGTAGRVLALLGRGRNRNPQAAGKGALAGSGVERE